MSVSSILHSMQNCPCGRRHTSALRAVEIGRGNKQRAAQILTDYGFPKRILVATQQSALDAAEGILDTLQYGGFILDVYLFDTVCVADTHAVERICESCRKTEGILSIGTGTVSDICRRAALLENKDFAIFATAPSMDGFASDTAPILCDHFKISLPARQPSVILADTEVLASAPASLKSAGYGDMLAKYIAIADWRIAHCLTGEYYCENVANITRSALRDVVAVTDRITENSPETAGILMHSLVMTGLAMQLCGSSRAAGGAEHVVSHFWESKQSERGERSDSHGRKVGVATGMIARLYDSIIRSADPLHFCEDTTDWSVVFGVYGDAFRPAVEACNFPSVLQNVTSDILRAHWDEIRQIVREEIPSPATIDELLRRAGAARTLADIGVDEQLGLQGLIFHPYMRHRVLLTRLLPMLGYSVDFRAALYPRSDSVTASQKGVVL